MMKLTIKAKTGYTVRHYTDRRDGKQWYGLLDGEDVVMYAELMSWDGMKAELQDNECFHICEVFETIKANRFVYCRDEEADIDYLVKVVNGRVW